MAESSLQDVVLKSQSVGVSSPSDAPATTTDNKTVGGESGEGEAARDDGFVAPHDYLKAEDQLLEDGSARSDTDTSRAGSIAGDNKNADMKPVKKFAVSKPVSFAKYSVPKTVVTNAPIRTSIEKAPSSTPTPTSASALGRPRLVAKSTTTLQQKTSMFKSAAPDPMQVWNKNRVTPQPSTKHLTDEELKQQYGIHLTSRLQTDGEAKESKWADIDDDEDDWAPETIEWNDGTKTTVNPADAINSKHPATAKPPAANASKSGLPVQKILTSSYSSSVGPNATVLKVGANAERQQLQRAASQQSKGATENTPLSGSPAMPAPTPAKSPWAKLPAIDKVSPIATDLPTAVDQPMSRYAPASSGLTTSAPPVQAPSPAKEISADDFSRTWRDPSASQSRELFMPSSGRYEAVPDNRRRLSRHEPNFRAPAVLQRPGQSDPRAPAEPSAAFQTHRTSVDQGRRRASSSISGGSGQIARRVSFRSTDVPGPAEVRRDPQVDLATVQPAVQEQQAPASPVNTYQARVDHPVNNPGPPMEIDIEAQRAAQKAAMRENIERARKRKIEEEQREEAEKQERIRARLAALGPPPPPAVPKAAHTAKEGDSEVKAQAAAASTTSPPKPPQPLATGEPQQYGMMKVHPLDSVTKISPTGVAQTEPSNANATSQTSIPEKQPLPITNGATPVQEPAVAYIEDDANPEPSPKFSKVSIPSVSDARAGWSSVRGDHRQQQSNNLWGLPSKKALGNGTFDQSLAGYSPQDLSRTSSTGQPWINGRTPTVGQSPQLHHATSQVPETRSQLLQSMTSPSQQPLNLNSEIDSLPPASRPAPIGPPPHTNVPQQMGHASGSQQVNGLAGWHNFHSSARVSEKADAERFQREHNDRREEEARTGVKQQAPYNFNETFKQVQLGDQAGQRHVTNVVHNSHVPNGIFGAVGSMPQNEVSKPINGQTGRGSRFFPVMGNGLPSHERRAVTYSHSEVPRTPSPPPAEDTASLHPAFDGNVYRPVVHFPREKAVVRLPPSAPLAAPTLPTPPVQDSPVAHSKTNLTWAARVSLPAPAPPARSVSTPIVQNPSWQERFNGLLGKKELIPQQIGGVILPAPTLAMTKEPFDVLSAMVASVSLPVSRDILVDASKVSSKKVEDEEDLFEDREAGSLPIVHLPRESLEVILPRVSIPRFVHHAIDPISVHMFMVNNWSGRHAQQKPQYAVIRVPGGPEEGVRKDLPSQGNTSTPPHKPRNVPAHFIHKYPRGKSGFKPRNTVKAQ